jgi:hypothetical protein
MKVTMKRPKLLAGVLLCAIGLFAAAIDCLGQQAQKPTKEDESSARFLFNTAREREKPGFYQDAIDFYKQVVETVPRSKLALRAQQRINELRATPEIVREEAKKAERKRKEAEAKQAAKARLEEYVQANPEYREAILNKKVTLGMSTDDVIASWGKPDHVNTTVTASGKHEQWVYGDQYLYFEDGRITSWQSSR